ncbi:cell division protein CrgA [Arthrobacter sp. H5]|uniref:cell division protein CrgA n=1 Tax=Arthrobacter sp. H5 TaxID=1267973 RepID=UPI000481FAAD|nr:cell division protein CrgA [Arthrobacter sp. H5]
MPESKSRKKPSESRTPASAEPKPNPVWYKPVMFGLMLLGLAWIITYYVSEAQFPIPSLDSWNIAIGFGIAIVGFLMTTRWR